MAVSHCLAVGLQVLKSGSLSSPALFFIQGWVDYFGFLAFLICIWKNQFINFFLKPCWNCDRDLQWSHNSLGKVSILTILRLLAHKHGLSCHLFRFSFILFSSVYSCLGKVLHFCVEFIIFDVIINRTHSLISFSDWLM